MRVSNKKISAWMEARASRTILVLLFVAGLIAGYFALAGSELMSLFTDIDVLISRARNLGIYGPLLLIGLMAMAIVFNPLPSAPIALGAGAIYGHTLGTVYIVAGAELGAMLAFMIARWAGYDLTRRFFGETGSLKGISSQNALTTLVFVSRLIPFMSFDLVSYAAGLSPIKPWRFAVATLLGLLPVSFALAHYGAEIGNGDYRTLVGIVLVIGLLTIVPILLRFSRHQESEAESEKSK
jgi:uncharacterized membrane protein YdjX (TVP38/TMEM64 family)